MLILSKKHKIMGLPYLLLLKFISAWLSVDDRSVHVIMIASWILKYTGLLLCNPPSLLARKVWPAVRWHLLMCCAGCWVWNGLCFPPSVRTWKHVHPLASSLSHLSFSEELRYILLFHLHAKIKVCLHFFISKCPLLSHSNECRKSYVYCSLLCLFFLWSCWVNVIFVNSA